MKPHITHVIGGVRIEESTGSSPPGDPLDRDEISSTGSRHRHQAKKSLCNPSIQQNVARSSSIHSTNSRPCTSGQSTTNSKSKPGSPLLRKTRKVLARKALGFTHVYREYDTDFDDEYDHDYSTQSENSEMTSGSSVMNDKEKKQDGRTVSKDQVSAKSGGKERCGYCGRPFDHRHTEAPKGFCSNTCARRGSSQPLTGSSIKRKPGRPFGSKNSKNLGSPARKSDRIRTKEPLPYDAFFDAEESNDSAPDRVRSRSFCSGSSSLKRGRSIVAAKSVKSPSSQSKKDEKEESHTHFMEVSGRDSPEIEAPAPSSSNNSSFVLPSEMESTSSKPADVQISEKEADKPSGKRHKSVAPYLSHVVRSYIMDKSDNVKSLITEKPVVSWDYSEVAAFVESVPGLGHLAIKMLTEQIDGQCLLLFDHDTWKEGFKLRVGDSVKMVGQIKRLEYMQRKHALRRWYDGRPGQFAAAVAFLDQGKQVNTGT